MTPTVPEYIKQLLSVDIIVYLDFETFYKTKGTQGNKSCSLRSKTYVEYILDDPRFQTLGLSYAFDELPIKYVHAPPDVDAVINTIKEARASGKRVAMASHNARFDGAVCAWYYGLHFDAYICTMDMRKLLYPSSRAGLAHCAKDEWPEDTSLHKGGAALKAIDGVHYEYITPEQHEQLGVYAIQDSNIMRQLVSIYGYRIIERGLHDEIFLMNMTLKSFIKPQFVIEHSLLKEVMADKKEEKRAAVQKAIRLAEEYDLKPNAKTFSSSPQYAKLLADLGVLVPMKISKKTGLLAPALAQDDPEYVKTQINHPELTDIFTARRLSTSNIESTRAQRMMDVSNTFKGLGRYKAYMPFFLNYIGAKQTGRFSGTEKLNQQNNTRGGKHRLSMRAPDPYVIGVCDLSNIELRVNMWVCGENDVLDKFIATDHLPDGHPDRYDYYSEVASGIFGYEIVKAIHKSERHMGKAAGLGLGFAMGWPGFQRYLATGPLGMEPMFKTDQFCRDVKNAYNEKHPHVVAMWTFIKNVVIPTVTQGGEVRFGPNDSIIARKDHIELPSGRLLHYPNAHYEGEETQNGFNMNVVFDSDKYDRFDNPVKKRMWHGLIIENIAQAIARDVLAKQLVDMERKLVKAAVGWVSGSVHDEALAMLLEDRADEGFALMCDTMKKPPHWAKGLPLANDGGYAKEYSK